MCCPKKRLSSNDQLEEDSRSRALIHIGVVTWNCECEPSKFLNDTSENSPASLAGPAHQIYIYAHVIIWRLVGDLFKVIQVSSSHAGVVASCKNNYSQNKHLLKLEA